MIRRKLVTRLNKKRMDPSQLAYGTDCILSFESVGSTVVVTANQQIVVDGKLNLVLETVGAPLESETTGAMTFTLTYDAATTGLDYTLAARDPAVRTATGGYALPASGTLT